MVVGSVPQTTVHNHWLPALLSKDFIILGVVIVQIRNRSVPPQIFGDRLAGLVVKASASGVEDPGFESHLHRDFSGVESYQSLKNWHSSGYPARRLAL